MTRSTAPSGQQGPCRCSRRSVTYTNARVPRRHRLLIRRTRERDTGERRRRRRRRRHPCVRAGVSRFSAPAYDCMGCCRRPSVASRIISRSEEKSVLRTTAGRPVPVPVPVHACSALIERRARSRRKVKRGSPAIFPTPAGRHVSGTVYARLAVLPPYSSITYLVRSGKLDQNQIVGLRKLK